MTFAIPALLAGLGALAAPILIHWLFRPRARRVRFPAAALMAAALASGRRAQRVRDLWLLLVRVLLLAAIVMLLAGPAPRGEPVDAAPDGPAAVAIVVDDSASTRYAITPDATLRDAIFNRAAEIIDEIAARPPGTLALVASTGDAARPRRAVNDFPALRRELAAARQRPAGGAPLGAAIAAAVRGLADARPTRKELIVVTDLAAHAWLDVEPGALRAMPGARVRVVCPEAGERTNLAIRIAAYRAGVVSETGGSPVAITVSSAGVGVAASLVIREGERVVDRVGPLDVEADAARTVTAALPARPAGPHGLAISLEPSDRLEFDQTAYLAWQSGPRPRAWFFRPARLTASDEIAELIWRNLLAPEALPEPQRPLEVHVFDDSRGIDPPPDPTAAPDLVVVMSGVDLNDPGRRAIASAVEGGAALLLACGGGAAVDWPGFRRFMLEDAATVERLEASQNLAWTPDAAEASRHDPGDEELTRTPIRRRLAFAVPPTVRVEATFADGRPAIVSRRVGKGEVLLLATSPDPAWSDLGLRAAGLLSWLNSLAVRNRPEADRAANFIVGEHSDRPFAGLPDRATVTVQPLGAGERQRIAIESGRPVEGWPTRSAGLFDVRTAGDDMIARYAVNWPASESDLTPVAADRVKSILGVDRVTIERQGGVTGEEAPGLGVFIRRLVDPNGLLVIALLALVAVETSLALRRRAEFRSPVAASSPPAASSGG